MWKCCCIFALFVYRGGVSFFVRFHFPLSSMNTIPEFLDRIKKQKSQLDALRPFDQSQLQNLREWFRVGFVHHSNAIEGNTLSLQEVKLVIEEGLTIWWKTVRELQETINHGKLMDTLHDMFEKNGFRFTKHHVLDLHRQLMTGLLSEKDCGAWRKIQVRISWTTEELPSPQQVPDLMEDFFATIANKIETLEDVAHIHYDFVKIHPFVDGNGRIARVLMNLALVSLGYFPIIIPRMLRQEYIDTLRGDRFEKRYQFFLWQVYENHKDYLRFLETQVYTT